MFNSIANYLFGSPSEVECAGSSNLSDPSTSHSRGRRSPDLADAGSMRHGCSPRKPPKDSWIFVKDSSSGEDLRSRLPVGPLENELIEHPSMSVYHPRGRSSSVGDSSNASSVDIAKVSNASVSTLPSTTSTQSRRATAAAALTAAAVVTHTHTSHHAHEVAQRRVEEALQRSARAQQSAKVRKEQKQLKRSQLKRRNDVTMKLASRPARRNQLQHCSRRSNAVNNRKSQ